MIESAVPHSTAAEAHSTRRPVHVLYYTGNLAVGGSEIHLSHLLTRMDRHRVRPELMLSRIPRDRTLIDRVEAAGVRIHEVGVAPGKRRVPRALARARRLIRQIRPDVLQTYGYPCDVYGPLLAGASRDIRVVTTRRGNQGIRHRWLLYRMTALLTDRVICVSDSSREFARRTQGLSHERSVVIPNGVDATRFRPRTTRPGRIGEVGTHGRVKPIKGVDMLLDAINLIEGAPRLRLAGPVNDRYGNELRERFGRSGSIEFVGEPDDIPGFLRSLDLYVLPSRSEGMSMALLEAMATGLPIVATDVGSNRAVLADGAAGLVVAPDPRSIADGIARMLREPQRASELGRAARQRVETEFSLDMMVRRFEEFYLQLVAEPAP